MAGRRSPFVGARRRLAGLAPATHGAGAFCSWFRDHKKLGNRSVERIGKGFKGVDGRVFASTLDTANVARLEVAEEAERLLRELSSHPQAAQVPGHQGTHSHQAGEHTSCYHLFQALKVVLFVQPPRCRREVGRGAYRPLFVDPSESAVVDFDPNINVWTLGAGVKGKWKLILTTDDLEQAVAVFQDLEQQGRQVAVYELGSFVHEGKKVVGQVGFWWSENLNEYMGGTPSVRGRGLSEDHGTLVNYIFPGEEQRSASSNLPTSSQPARYAEATCDRCGKILPMNELKRLSHNVTTGGFSGTNRVSRSTTTRISSRGVSSSYTNGSSSSSGRRYYKRETVMLCAECYRSQVGSDGLSGLLNFFGQMLVNAFR